MWWWRSTLRWIGWFTRRFLEIIRLNICADPRAAIMSESMFKLILLLTILPVPTLAKIAITGGLRNTLSLFDDGGWDEPAGYGAGGQLRVHFAEHFGTEWFYDYITASLSDEARRVTQHIGWSVLYYPISLRSEALWMPYVVAGHCFDNSEVVEGDTRQDRWSSAVQMGLGMQLNLGPRFDMSLSSQYMIHLGKDLDGEHHTLEGHWLTSLSVNFHFLEF